jgi:hypothetical protein
VFGTLGVGAGFALGAKLVRPNAEVWIVYGDGSVGYSLSEYDTFVRHKLPVIGVVGNDASWMQIAREQVEMLGDSVGTDLRRTDYHIAAQGLGGVGLELRDPARIDAVLAEAKAAAKAGQPGADQRPPRAHRLPQGLDLDVRPGDGAASGSTSPSLIRGQSGRMATKTSWLSGSTSLCSSGRG